MTRKERAKLVNEGIELVWDSLSSHLPYTIKCPPSETKKFHIKCVKEYVRLLQILSSLY